MKSYLSGLFTGRLMKIRVSSWYFLCKDKLKPGWVII